MDKELTSGPAVLKGTCAVPGDKSISHRSVMLGALAKGTTTAKHFLFSADCLHTIAVFKALGVPIETTEDTVTIQGVGLKGLKPPKADLDMGNSGTSTRLLLGLLARQPFAMTFIGDDSLSQRPMGRVLNPLAEMGAQVTATDGRLPLTIQANAHLKPLDYTIPVASAQVKSALIFAALQADGPSHLTEKLATRDHTERMLQYFGGHLEKDGLTLTVQPNQTLTGKDLTVPGDPSSAAFFVAAATLLAGSDLTLTHVGLNPTRTGFLEVIGQMNGNISVANLQTDFEPTGDLKIKSADLTGITLTKESIPSVIDELPLVVLCATQAQGVTEISGAEELRVKETDRISTVVTELTKMGAKIEEKPDGMIITGPTPLHKVQGTLNSYGDHRIAMMLMVAALLTKDDFTLQQAEAIAVSYPDFYDDLLKLLVK